MLAAPVYSYGYGGASGPESFHSNSLGDADMLPNGDRIQYVKGWNGAYISEVSYPESEELWRLNCPDAEEIYRVQYFESLYDTSWWYRIDR